MGAVGRLLMTSEYDAAKKPHCTLLKANDVAKVVVFPAVCVIIAPPESGPVRYEHDYITNGSAERRFVRRTSRIITEDRFARALDEPSKVDISPRVPVVVVSMYFD